MITEQNDSIEKFKAIPLNQIIFNFKDNILEANKQLKMKQIETIMKMGRDSDYMLEDEGLVKILNAALTMIYIEMYGQIRVAVSDYAIDDIKKYYLKDH